MIRQIGFWIEKNVNIVLYAYVIVSMLVLTIIIERYNTRQYLEAVRKDYLAQTNAIAVRLESEFSELSVAARALEATISAFPDISHDQYAVIAARLRRDSDYVMNIAAAPGLVVRYVFPFEPNKAVLGFDYRTSPEQFTAVNRAIIERSIQIDGPLNLVQGSRGFIVRSPVFTTDELSGTEHLWGIVSVVVSEQKFFSKAGLDLNSVPFRLAIRNVSRNGEPQVAFWGDPDVFSRDPVTRSINLPSGSWQIAAEPLSGWPIVSNNYLVVRAWISFAGILVLLTAFYLLRIRRRERVAEQKLRDAIEALDDAFVLFDNQDRFVLCNTRYREMNAMSSDVVVPGSTFEDIIRAGVARGQYPEAAGCEEKWISERLEQHRSTSQDIKQVLADGSSLKISEQKTSDGGTVGLIVDITDYKNAQKAAEAANKAKTEFMNVMNHELRTPLTVVLGFNSFLQKPENLPAVKSLLKDFDATKEDEVHFKSRLQSVLTEVSVMADRIGESGQHLLRLINGMLDLSKIEEGKLELKPSKIQVHPLLDSVAQQFENIATQKMIDLKVNSEDGELLADEFRLKQILINLTGNAIKFTDSGSVTLTARKTDDGFFFSVRDTGRGIPAEFQSAIFKRFKQLDSSSRRTAGGTGLGLTLTKELVELHGGTIALSSPEHGGSDFSFTLPNRKC